MDQAHCSLTDRWTHVVPEATGRPRGRAATSPGPQSPKTSPCKASCLLVTVTKGSVPGDPSSWEVFTALKRRIKHRTPSAPSVTDDSQIQQIHRLLILNCHRHTPAHLSAGGDEWAAEAPTEPCQEGRGRARNAHATGRHWPAGKSGRPWASGSSQMVSQGRTAVYKTWGPRSSLKPGVAASLVQVTIPSGGPGQSPVSWTADGRPPRPTPGAGSLPAAMFCEPSLRPLISRAAGSAPGQMAQLCGPWTRLKALLIPSVCALGPVPGCPWPGPVPSLGIEPPDHPDMASENALRWGPVSWSTWQRRTAEEGCQARNVQGQTGFKGRCSFCRHKSGLVRWPCVQAQRSTLSCPPGESPASAGPGPPGCPVTRARTHRPHLALGLPGQRL